MKSHLSGVSSNCGEIHKRHGVGPFVGRLLIALIFLLGALGKISIFPLAVEMLKNQGVQGGVETYLVMGIVLELIGALMILLGWYTRIGCWILMIFLIVPTFIVHGFWNYQGMEVMNQSIHFLKNIAIYGGLLLLASYGPGLWSLDARRCTRYKK